MTSTKQNSNQLVLKVEHELIHPELHQLLEKARIDEFTPEKVKRHYQGYIPSELLKTAYENAVLDEMPKYKFGEGKEDKVNEVFSEGFEKYYRAFFDTHFVPLLEIGVKFETSIVELQKIAQKAEETAPKYMSGQYKTFCETWAGVKKAFEMVFYLSSHSLLQSKHLNSVSTFTQHFASLADIKARWNLAVAYGNICEINKTMGISEIPDVLSPAEFKTILFACPVLFHSNESENAIFRAEAAKKMNLSGDQMMFLSFFNDMFKVERSDHFDHFMKVRSIKKMPTHETFPIDIPIKVKANEQQVCGELILTPYTNFRLKEMNDFNWARYTPLDPYAVQILNVAPLAIITRRWSGTGVLPGVNELIANTVLFLKENKTFLIDKISSSISKWRGVFKKSEEIKVFSYVDVSSSSQVSMSPEDAGKFVDKLITMFTDKKLNEFFR